MLSYSHGSSNRSWPMASKSTPSTIGGYNAVIFNVARARPSWTRVPLHVRQGSSAHPCVARRRDNHALLSRQLYALRHQGSYRNRGLCVQRWQHPARLHSRCLYVVSLQFLSTNSIDWIDLFPIPRLVRRAIAPLSPLLDLEKLAE